MKVFPTSISDVLIIEPTVYTDNRGFFFESFNHHAFEKAIGKKINFTQDNHSYSKKGVLRGLHYQLAPMEQGKLVRVVDGEVFDVAVDIRKNSPTFGKWVGEILSKENKKQLWIPEGFAHGYLVLSDNAEFLYKTTNYWSREHEKSIRFDDPTIGIQWPNLHKLTLQISDKDLAGSSLLEA